MPNPTPEATLQTLARLDPDFPTFAAALPSEVARAARPLPPGFAEDVLALLRQQRPELTPWLDAQRQSAPDKFAVDPLLAIGAVTAALFLLRSHIKIGPDGITFEHKPLGDNLLEKVLEALAKLF